MNGNRIKGHIAPLDALRGIAAVCVVAHHVGQLSGMHIARHGFIAVDFFFMLSGFVVSRAYERSFGNNKRAAMFMFRRIERLYPTVFIGLILGIIAIYMGGLPGYALGAWVFLQFFLLPVLSGRYTFPLDGPLWSIFFELFINAVHAVVFRWLTVRLLCVTVALSGAAFLALIIAYPDNGASLGFQPGISFVGGFVRVIFGYFVGVFIFRLSEMERLPNISLPFPFLALALLFLIAGPSIGPRPIPDIVAVFVGFPAILLFSLKSRMAGWITPIGQWMGAISFPLYAMHLPLLQLAKPAAHGPLAWAIVSCAVLALATAAEYCIDKPLRVYLKAKRTKAERAASDNISLAAS